MSASAASALCLAVSGMCSRPFRSGPRRIGVTDHGNLHPREIIDAYFAPCDVMGSQQWQPLFHIEHKTRFLIGVRAGFSLPGCRL